MKNNIISGIFKILGVLIILQLLRFGIENLFFVFVERTNFTDRIASFIAMTLLTCLFLWVAKKKEFDLSIFPKRFTGGYIAGTTVFLALFISTPIIIGGWEFGPVFLLIYGSVITPIYEELVFRGFVWNKLKTIFKNEWAVYVLSAVIFGVWHLGYIDSLAFRLDDGLANAMLWKSITGFCFGVILGLLRLKTKNCYSTMLLHGALNIFGR